MDLGSETAKHCMVSYFCCDASCWSDAGRASPSAYGLISMRQLKVWLFRLDESLPRWLTAREKRGRKDGLEAVIENGSELEIIAGTKDAQ